MEAHRETGYRRPLGVFPYTLFLQAPYSEGLFLALALGTFLAAERRRTALAAVLEGLALLTRPTGAVLLAAMAILARQGRNRVRALAWLEAGRHSTSA